MKRIHLVAALAAAVVVAAGVWYWPGTRGSGSFTASQTRPDGRRPAAPAAAAEARVAALAPGRSARAGAPADREVLHPDLPQVLPGLAGPVADWRDFKPGELTVSPIPGVAITFAARRITSDGRHTVWTGASGTPGVTFASSATQDRWDAIVSVPGALEYDIHVSPAGVTVEKIDFGSERCEADITTSMQLPPAPAAPTPPVAAAGDATYTSDLLVLYTTAAGNAMGGAAAVDNSVTARIATSNTYLAQSQVNNITWHLVGVVEAPGYTETGNLDTDLNNLINPTTAIGAFAVQQGRQYGADQVLLIVSHSDDNFAGEAMTPGSYAVVISTGSAGIVAHELGHNFGCHHDRQTEKAADNDGRYYYGYRYRDATNRDVGTIMSYASFRVPYFSNPNLTYQGHILGLAAGDPQAADNARVLRENAAYIANMRPSASGPPVITSQPASVTVIVGQAFTLSVTATGQNLAYRWTHDGMTIPAATASAYAVNSSTTADSGAYVVTISNAAGSVQSSTATVTVNPAGSAPPPPATSGSTSGGGGGGGALDPWAVLALVLLLLRAVAAEPAGARQRRSETGGQRPAGP